MKFLRKTGNKTRRAIQEKMTEGQLNKSNSLYILRDYKQTHRSQIKKSKLIQKT